jgi:hypothetical protein
VYLYVHFLGLHVANEALGAFVSTHLLKFLWTVHRVIQHVFVAIIYTNILFGVHDSFILKFYKLGHVFLIPLLVAGFNFVIRKFRV